MLQKWHKGMAAAAVVALLVSGCGQKPAPQGTGAIPPATSSQGSGSGNTQGTSPQTPQTPVQPQEKQLKMKAYFSDDKLENLVEKEVSITYKQDQDKYAAALKALTVSSDPKAVPLFKGFTFKSVVFKNGALTIDLSMSPESRLGSGGEEMLLRALQNTLFQFSEVQTFDVLLDGKKVESLMGHMDLPHPFKRGQK
ncbi:GerMN domain-containing protein [Paenibacillus allorhizosphaerae]|uniref:GerMN domain-containing protein n=1 Tax=Paenibacillus allorhizosphaerae TaxID=2849866 RepID=A0ABM8VLQ4_9BACL|nr:GerMN domain-containing protein [Paenibacillus allorhizosphaerae]CAG7648763.1 hypothetical protein PAECIP111802_04316 [Paenibacillus allorhizosphaerae]